MADQKLSVLTELAVEPADTDEVYINDGGTSKRITYGTLKTALLARANHTGTQLASTISDFASAVAATSEVTANTAKLSADDPALISALAEVTAEGTDYAVILDTSVSPNALKKILISDLLDNASHTGDVTGSAALTAQPAIITGKGAVTVDAADLLLVTDVSASPQVLGQVTAQSIADLRQLTADDVIGEGPGAVDGADVLLTVDVSASPQILARTTAASVASLATPEGTAILSTGEVGASKFLREDGDGTCSWQTVVAGTGDFMADGSVPMTGNLTFAAASPELTVDGRNVSADGAKLDGIEAGATADQTANEILTALLTVDGTASLLDADLLDGNEATAFATAAQANATHSGDATGDTALTLQPAAITGKGAVTVAGADHVLVVDDSASPQTLGKTTAQAVADLAKPTESIIVACSDETTALTTGAAKVTFRMPYAFTLSEVRATVTTAPVGSSIIVDINEKVAIPSPDVPTSILSTRLYIDAGEFSSEDASVSPAHQSVISDTSLADDSEITIDIDQIGASTAGAGLKVELIGKRT